MDNRFRRRWHQDDWLQHSDASVVVVGKPIDHALPESEAIIWCWNVLCIHGEKSSSEADEGARFATFHLSLDVLQDSHQVGYCTLYVFEAVLEEFDDQIYF